MHPEPDDPVQATELDRHMMRRALDRAREAAAMDEVPVGAVVYRGQQVLAEAFNRRESDSDPTSHAEILAMRQAARRLGDWRLSDCTLVVTLEPCAMCAGAIVNGRVGRLVYGARDPKMGAVESLYRLCNDKRMNHEPKAIVAGLM
ncbi:MAG: nucleoside deaminase, partial [Phycisphaeraceae bacterium]|nr:nucleoside deaminase [Phycisphaeraceae bacterium]